MGIYIKGMKMPKSCWSCDMSLTALKCPVQTEEEAMRYCSCRHKDCPLIAVPAHGGLIDLKAPFKAQYYDEMTEDWLEKIVTVEDVLYGCMVDEMPPTIIPAEEGE